MFDDHNMAHIPRGLSVASFNSCRAASRVTAGGSSAGSLMRRMAAESLSGGENDGE